MDGPLEQPGRWRFGDDEQNGLVETGIDQRLLDLLRQLQVEGIFRHAAGAQRAGHVEGVADIDDDAECRWLAVRMRRRGAGRRLVFAAGRMRVCGREQKRKRCEQEGSGVLRLPHALPHNELHRACPRVRHTCARRAAVVPNKTYRTKQDLSY